MGPDLTEIKREIEELTRQAAALAERELPPAEFYAQLLERAVYGLAALGGTVWEVGPDNHLSVVASQGPEAPQTAERLARLNSLAGRRSLVIEPQNSDDTAPLVLLCSVQAAGQTLTVVEIRQRPAANEATQRGYLRFLEAFCEQAANYHQRLERRRFQERAQFARALDDFALAVHGSLSASNTAISVANEGRRLLEADRLTVCAITHGSARALATSSVDVLDRRAPLIVALEALGSAAAATEDDLDLPSDQELPPQLASATQRAVDVGHAKALSVAFLRPPAADPNERSAAMGLLIAEWLREAPDTLARRERLSGVARHASAALANALEHESLPLSHWLAPWAKRPGRAPRSWKWRMFAATALVAAAAGALTLVSTDYRLSAQGELWPQERRNVFAPASAVVHAVHVEHGQTVAAGAPLVTLRDSQLEFELARVEGELATARKRLASIQAERISGLPEEADAFAKFQQRTAEEEEIKLSLATLEQQFAILRRQEQELTLRAPIAGEVLTWRPDQLLAGRPVERGQLLLRVANAAGPWMIEAHLPQDYASDLQAARGDGAAELPVTFALLTDPTTNYRGHVKRLAQVVELDAQDQPSVELDIAIDERPRSARAGAGVLARIDCGRRSWGYVLFHDAARALAGWWY
jgi:multidrug efflux pump subunit AcrA (membrane-fusion protein)